VTEKNPEIVTFTKTELRPRVLSDEHFEFRDVEAQDVPRYREARLRPEYEHLYPWLIPSVWHPAAVVVEKAVFWAHQQRRGLVAGDRGSLRPVDKPKVSLQPDSCREGELQRRG